MPRDYFIDPTTNDLVKDGKGGFVMVETAQTSVYNQLKAKRGKCWHDEELGSDLHDLRAIQSAPERLAPEAAKLALGRLVRARRIDAVEVRGELAPAPGGRVLVVTRFRDTTSGSLVETRLKTGG